MNEINKTVVTETLIRSWLVVDRSDSNTESSDEEDAVAAIPKYRPEASIGRPLSDCALIYDDGRCVGTKGRHSNVCNDCLDKLTVLCTQSPKHGLVKTIYYQLASFGYCRWCSGQFSRKNGEGHDGLRAHEESSCTFVEGRPSTLPISTSNLIPLSQPVFSNPFEMKNNIMNNIVEGHKLRRDYINDKAKFKRSSHKYMKSVIAQKGFNLPLKVIEIGKNIWKSRPELLAVLCTDGSATMTTLQLALKGDCAAQVVRFSEDCQSLIHEVNNNQDQKLLPVGMHINFKFVNPSDGIYRNFYACDSLTGLSVKEFVLLSQHIIEFQYKNLRPRHQWLDLDSTMKTLYEFIVGKNVHSHTVIQQFEQLLERVKTRSELCLSSKCTGVYTSAGVSYQSKSLMLVMCCYFFYGLGSSKGSSSFRLAQFKKLLPELPKEQKEFKLKFLYTAVAMDGSILDNYIQLMIEDDRIPTGTYFNSFADFVINTFEELDLTVAVVTKIYYDRRLLNFVREEEEIITRGSIVTMILGTGNKSSNIIVQDTESGIPNYQAHEMIGFVIKEKVNTKDGEWEYQSFLYDYNNELISHGDKFLGKTIDNWMKHIIKENKDSGSKMENSFFDELFVKKRFEYVALEDGGANNHFWILERGQDKYNIECKSVCSVTIYKLDDRIKLVNLWKECYDFDYIHEKITGGYMVPQKEKKIFSYLNRDLS